MALIKCPECGKEISDKADSKQPVCVDNIDEPKKKLSKKSKIIISLSIGCTIIIGILAFVLTKDIRAYHKGKQMMDNQNYSKAVESFSTITDYKDTNSLYTKCLYEYGKQLISEEKYKKALECFSGIREYKDTQELYEKTNHLFDIQNDTTPPKIVGIDNKTIVEVEYREEFNINTYLSNIVSITDNISGDIDSYGINSDSEIFDKDTGKINTNIPGEYKFTISASDEAGNIGTVAFKLKIKDIVYVTPENPNPIVYEGDSGKISIQSCKYGYINGLQQYQITFFIENNSDTTMSAWLYDGYFNNLRAQAYTDAAQISSGKSGSTSSDFSEDDLTEEMKTFENIETTFCFGTDAFNPYDFTLHILLPKNVFVNV